MFAFYCADEDVGREIVQLSCPTVCVSRSAESSSDELPAPVS